MKSHNRDLLVLLKTDFNQQAFEKEVACLHQLLVQVECNDAFCAAHELVARIKITSKKKALLKASAQNELRPFYFLINKN
jgi:hypothetical protein